jgi:hypothetical protein
MTLEPGMYDDCPHDLYHADPAPGPSLSGSVAVTLAAETPRHAFYQHVRLGKSKAPSEEESKIMDFGSICHLLILGKGQDFEIGEFDNFTTKAAKEFRDSAREAGKIPVLRPTYVNAQKLRDETFNWLADGKSEVTCIWKPEPDLFARCRVDRLTLGANQTTIFDLKISGSSDPDFAARNIYDMGYDIKACHLSAGVTAAHPDSIGRTRVIYVYVENKFPFLCTPVEMTGMYQAIGQTRYDRALKRWGEGMRTGKWPSYATGVVRVEAPKYAEYREMMSTT